MIFVDHRAGADAGKVRHKIRDIPLQCEDQRLDFFVLAKRARHAQRGIHLVNDAISLDAGRILVDTLSRIKARLPLVPRLCVYAHTKTSVSEKNMAISRAADSGLSDACTALRLPFSA